MTFMFKKTKKRALEPDRLPRHIAIIMDGNGRWAAKRALPRTAGHAAGAETFRRIATYCKDIGLEYLTVYAFSTENRSRPAEEVATIMELLEKYLYEALEKMERDRVKMKFFGDVSVLSPKLRELISQTEELSKTFDGVQVNICVNYGGRSEIIRAAEMYARDVTGGAMGTSDTSGAEDIAGAGASGAGDAPVLRGAADTSGAEDFAGAGAGGAGDALRAGRLTEEAFSKYMYSSGIPDPDLVIRPGGEMRVSNFLIWQAAYAEFYFSDVLWPDFDERELDKAILSYQSRERRFGGLGK
ncbi:MAG: polyprenyl diphosphate synthase [Oscillospiraceae bacterium]|nr:polyprenyl diphosphate synthase [Oscillospiraceae bacterium]